MRKPYAIEQPTNFITESQQTYQLVPVKLDEEIPLEDCNHPHEGDLIRWKTSPVYQYRVQCDGWLGDSLRTLQLNYDPRTDLDKHKISYLSATRTPADRGCWFILMSGKREIME